MPPIPLADSSNLVRWQDKVKDDTLLSQLSIPGTHNSGACYIALPSVQCQGASITEQLNHGVRFFDLRIAKPLFTLLGSPDDLQIIHGKFPVRAPVSLKLTDVLEEIYAFTQNNPTEVPIVSIKQEGSGTWEGDEFPNLIWKKYIGPNQDKWFLENKIPKLGEARGKVMLFRRFGVSDESRKENYGFDASWWKYNTPNDDRGRFDVQDWCEVQEPTDLSTKVKYVNEQLVRAVQFNSTQEATEQDKAKLFVNFCSGSNFFKPECWPRGVSEAVSKDINGLGVGCGIVILDFAESEDWKIPRQLVQTNLDKFQK